MKIENTAYVNMEVNNTNNCEFVDVMSCHVMSCHVMSCHVMSCHVMSCHVMSLSMSCHGTYHNKQQWSAK